MDCVELAPALQQPSCSAFPRPLYPPTSLPLLMIEVRDLKKSFGSNSILDGVSFRIEKGESVVIIGRSGGGKSVLLKHLIGLLQPDAGQVLIAGEDIVPMNERA